VTDQVVDEYRLVVGNQADDVLAGDVLRRQQHDARPVEIAVEVDAQQARVRLGRAERMAVPRTGKYQVVGIECLAGQLGRALTTLGQAACSAKPQLARRRCLEWSRRGGG
jgi:hypothetical protein